MTIVGGRRVRGGVEVGVAVLGLSGWLAATVAGGATPADPLAVSNAYGSGVHAFHTLDFGRAHEAFSAAIDAGTEDPRAYYFRGLAALKLGRIEDADIDFAEGANREAAGAGGINVSRSLERVQGCDRLRLEQFRARARIAAVQRDEGAIRGRYADIYDAEADVRRRVRPRSVLPQPEPLVPPAAKPVAPGRAVRPEPGVPAEAAERPSLPRRRADPADPFGDDGPMTDDRLDQRDQLRERGNSERDDVFDQRDQQMEDRASETDDALDQRDAQEEREAAGGGR